jgi:hypothetical protein
MGLKPCIECGKECEILPMQLGDLFTLTYLRVCSAECLFLIVYEFLVDIGDHKQLRGKLYDLQNKEDKKDRDDWVKVVTDESLKIMKEHLDANPLLLSTPIPNIIVETFRNNPGIPQSGRETMRFSRPTKMERIKWARNHVKKLNADLKKALCELEAIENEL